MEPSKEINMSLQVELPRRVAVKFLDDFNIPYEDGAEQYFSDDWKKRWDGLVEIFPGATLKRIFTAVSPERIKELVANAVRQDPTYLPPNFLTFFAIDSPSLDLAGKLAEVLTGWDVVEYAYIESLPSLPTIQPQHYVEPPTPTTTNDIGGINARYAWGVPGGSGSGVKFIDIEKGWCLTHPDLLDIDEQQIIPDPPAVIYNYGYDPNALNNNYEGVAHGTSVLGILIAQDNLIHPEWRGIAYQATGAVISPWGGTPPTANQQPGTWNVSNAIMNAIDALDFGDVLLLEVQAEEVLQVQLPDIIRWPAEFENNSFASIRLATASGIVVVEAAANGKKELGAQFAQDSGAIIVGAAKPTNISSQRTKGSRSDSSNYGNRVNCFAWGDTVYSLHVNPATGNPGNPTSPLFTKNFTGTSAASAIVAGAAIVVQGIAQARFSQPNSIFRYSALQMRNILGDQTMGINTPSANPADDKIGVMPNLKEIIDRIIGISPDVVVRDNLADDGDPHINQISASPDVIVRPADGSITNPQNSFGGGNPNMGNGNLSWDLTTGDQEIYVRVFNRGGAAATGTRATVYWSLPGTNLLDPDRWTKINTSIPPPVNVPVGMSSMTVLSKIPWPSSQIPVPGHYCFIATVGCDGDPDPIPDHTTLTRTLTFDEFYDLIRSNNNITWKNFNVIPVLSNMVGSMRSINFLAPGAYDIDRLMQLEVVARLPEGAHLELEGASDFINAMVKGQFEKNMSADKMKLPLSPHGVNRFREIVFLAKSLNPLQLQVTLPKEHRRGAYEIFVRHLYKGEEIGRITWQFVPERKDEESL